MTIKICDCCGQEVKSLFIINGYKVLNNVCTPPYRPVELCNTCFETTYENIRKYSIKKGIYYDQA